MGFIPYFLMKIASFSILRRIGSRKEGQIESHS